MMWRLAFWWRGWRYRRQARHLTWCDWCGNARCTCRVVEQAPEQDFYGSMTLAKERSWLPAPEVAHSGWWGQTAADLAPEALAVVDWAGPAGQVIDLGYLSLPAELQEAIERAIPAGSQRPPDSGPGDLTSLAPGPDTDRLAWLDRQLASHAEWARRMRGQVTGWGLEAAA